MGASESNRKFGKARKNGLKSVSGDWQGFVDIPLDDIQRQQLTAFLQSDEYELDELLGMVCGDGYKLSCGPQNRGNSFVASLTGRSPECLNLGYTLSAFGPTPTTAIGAVLYKHLYVCSGGVWSNFASEAEKQLPLFG